MNTKVKDLAQTDTITNSDKFMVLVDDTKNLVKNINKEDFVTNLISSAADNALEQAVDGSLFVNTSEIADDLAALSNEVATIESNIGDLSDLTTTDKTNLVAAINEAAESGGGTHFNLLEFKWCDHLLNDVSWLRADTFSWQSGSVYVTAYNHLVDDIDGITAETETIGSYTVTFYRAADGHKICLADQEQTVLNIYNETGIAWYYILDTTNTQFKLPRTKYGFEGLRGNVGNLIPQDVLLPNITGNFGLVNDKFNYLDGVFGTATTSTRYTNGLNSSGNGTGRVNFNASRSSSVYSGDGTNTNIQERATQMYLYFYVGDYTQTAVEQTAGLNSELFNGKADITGNNIIDNLSPATKSYLYSLRQPSTQVINNVMPTNGTYTAPADGEIVVRGYKTATTGSGPLLMVNDLIVALTGNYNASNASYAGFNYKVQAGDVIATGAFTSVEYSCFRYAKGAI